MTAQRPLWTAPYGAKEALLAVAALILTGFLLQLAAGPFDFYLLTFPGSAMACGLLVAGGAVLGIAARRGSALALWLTGPAMAALLSAGLMLVAVLMGSVPQVPVGTKPGEGFLSRLGLDAMTSSWPMILCYAVTCLSLAGVIVRRLRAGRTLRNATFLTAHLGLLVVLLSAGVGSADMTRYVMHVPVGETQWRVFAGEDRMLELPVAITLHSFTYEEYPPKLLLVDGEGVPQPAGKPQTWQIDTRYPDGRLGDWDFHVDSFLPRAVYAGNDAFRPMEIPGAAPAVKVTATKGGESHTGWISGGNMDNFQHLLNLDANTAMVVTPAEPKRFASDVTVLVRGDEPVRAVIEVNSPLRIGNWIIYQYGYDAANAHYARYSSFELVADPWLTPVMAGFALIALSACLLIWNGRGTAPRRSAR